MRRVKIGFILIAALLSSFLLVRGINRKTQRESAQHHFEEGNRLQIAGELPQAIEQMKLAVADDPTYFEARLGLSDYYESANKKAEAEAVLEEGIQAAPKDKAKYLLALGDLYIIRADYPKAIASVRESLSLNSNQQNSYRQVCMLLEKSGNWTDTVKEWEMYINPSCHPVR